MRRASFILVIILLLSSQTMAQHSSFIGKSKEEVKELVSKNHKGFSFDNTVVKQQFNYLKYVNGPQTITWIIYFSDKDICTSTKKVCDYTEYDFVVEKLNESFTKVNDNKWKFNDGNNKYELTLEELDWYFTIREREKK